MSASLDEKVDSMKREIDALQISVMGSARPWYKSVSTILSVVALAFSFGTTYVSYRRTTVQDIQNMRQELRGLLQRLAALPKENLEAAKKYPDDPGAAALVGGFINQENSLLARQAAELAKKLPIEAVSGNEYYSIGVALQNSYDLDAASEFLKYSIQAGRDFNTEIAALRAIANMQFVKGHPEAGRVEYQKALDIFAKYPGYDPFTTISTNVWTQLSWAYSEAGIGAASLVRQHIENAESLLAGLPVSPGAEKLSAQVSHAKRQLAGGAPTQNPVVGPQLGAVK